MNPLEYVADLQDFKKAVADRKIRGFEYLELLASYDPQELTACGYRNREHALTDAIKRTQKDVKKLSDDFTKKYPD
jgi:hypothetical protein